MNIAARMAALAKAGQILTTGQTVGHLPGYARTAVRRIDTLPVKGREQALEIYDVIWQWGERLTIVDARDGCFDPSIGTLFLEHARGSLPMHGGRLSVTLGRDLSADIVLTHQKSSRSHARVERRRDSFVLADTSINGTFVQFDGDRELVLRRKELVLRSAGTISCGVAAGAGDAQSIRFRIEQENPRRV